MHRIGITRPRFVGLIAAEIAAVLLLNTGLTVGLMVSLAPYEETTIHTSCFDA